MSERFITGLDCDEMPGAIGPFGKTMTNPIPVNGPIGELKYLSRLRMEEHPIMYHRLTSSRYGLSDIEAVDIYELCDITGKNWDILYLHMYHPRRSTTIPDGYQLADYHPVFTKLGYGLGVANFVGHFPYYLNDVLDQEYGSRFGLGSIYGNLFQNDEQYVRPIEHLIRVLSVDNPGAFFEALCEFIAKKYSLLYLAQLLRSADVRANIAGLKVIILRGVEAKSLLDAIVELEWRVEDEAIRELIGDALLAIMPEMKSVIPKAIEMIRNKPNDEDNVRLAMMMIITAGYGAIPYLTPLLYDRDSRIVRIAKQLIEKIREKWWAR